MYGAAYIGLGVLFLLTGWLLPLLRAFRALSPENRLMRPLPWWATLLLLPPLALLGAAGLFATLLGVATVAKWD